jgi:hypothetical protein
MVQITWDKPGERRFEAGIDRGVLYYDNVNGVAWNGLISVTEAPSGGEPRPYYVDGVKYVNVPSIEDFAGTIEAFTYPPEFEILTGLEALFTGLFVTQQIRKPFGLSYRTKLGDDISGAERGYKLHLVYNVLTSPSERLRETLGDAPEAMSFSWDFTTTPIPVNNGLRPMAHITIDSTRVSSLMLRKIEEKLYGTSSTPPQFLTPQDIITLYETILPGHFLIEEDLIGGMAELIEGSGSDLEFGPEDGLYIAPAASRLTETATDGLYILED